MQPLDGCALVVVQSIPSNTPYGLLFPPPQFSIHVQNAKPVRWISCSRSWLASSVESLPGSLANSVTKSAAPIPRASRSPQ